MANEKLFFVGLKALITDKKGKILLFKAETAHHRNKTPYWDIPGGRVQHGETITQTLHREIEEETGVTDIKTTEFWTSVVSKHEIPIDEGDTLAGLVLMIYKITIPEDSNIRISPEHTEYGWFTPLEAAKLLADKYPAEFTDLLK